MALVVLVVLAAGGWFGGRYLWASYHFRAAEKARERYEFCEELDELERCLRVWPDRVPTRLQAARAARRCGRLDRAAQHLDICEKKAVTPQSAMERALLQAQKGELEEVEGTLVTLVLKEDPDTVVILEALAWGYLKVNRRADAYAAIARLLEKVPNFPDAYFLRGQYSEREGHLGNAIAYYRRALDRAPHRVAFRLALADALVQFGQPAEAWPLFEELLGDTPDDAGVLLGAGRCLRALGRGQAALEYLDMLLRDHPDNVEGWIERGRACKDQGNSAEALRCLRRGYELNPRNAKNGFLLVTELRAQKKVQEADALWEKLRRLERGEQRVP
jgi:tetratricopeptide (TPR) repeat protein